MKKLSPPSLVLAAFLCLLTMFVYPASAQSQSQDQEQVQSQIEKGKIFRDAYPLIADVDLYCSVYICEGELPAARITAAEQGYEKIQFSDNDIVFINQGKQDGIEVGQVFLVVEIGDPIAGLGYLANKRGRAHVISLEDKLAVVRLEKTCGRLTIGNYLLPFEEKESLLGKDMGYEEFTQPEKGTTGNIVYLERDYNQIGSGSWAILDIGEEDGVQTGQQMTIYKQIRDEQSLKIREDLPLLGIGNLIIIDTGKKWATAKVLSCKDSVRKGYLVQMK